MHTIGENTAKSQRRMGNASLLLPLIDPILARRKDDSLPLEQISTQKWKGRGRHHVITNRVDRLKRNHARDKSHHKRQITARCPMMGDAGIEGGIKAVMKTAIVGACMTSETNERRNTWKYANGKFEMLVLDLVHGPTEQESLHFL